MAVSPQSDLSGEPIAPQQTVSHAREISQPETFSAETFPRGGFSRSQRLLSHADFQDVYANGRRQFAPHLTVFYLDGRDCAEDCAKGTPIGPRIGLAVASALGGAVVRNRIRRRLRAAVRPNLRKLTAPVDLVIQAKKSVLAAEFVELVREIENAFRVVQSQAVQAGNSASSGSPSRKRK